MTRLQRTVMPLVARSCALVQCIEARRIIDRLEMSPIRRNGELVRTRVSLGQHKPGPTVDEFARRVEVSGVDRCLGKHVQDDLADVVEPPVAEELFGPPGGRGVWRGGGDDGVREVYLLPVRVKDHLDRHVGADFPGVVWSHSYLVDDDLLARDDAAEPEALVIEGEMP